MPTVEDILMTKGPDVVVGSPEMTVLEASRLMAAGNVGAIVVEEGRKPLGIFTERDLLKKVVAKEKPPWETALRDVMSAPVKTCGLGDDILAVGDVMEAEHIRHLAVVEQDALIGVISFRDVLRAQTGR